MIDAILNAALFIIMVWALLVGKPVLAAVAAVAFLYWGSLLGRDLRARRDYRRGGQ